MKGDHDEYGGDMIPSNNHTASVEEVNHQMGQLNIDIPTSTSSGEEEGMAATLDSLRTHPNQNDDDDDDELLPNNNAAAAAAAATSPPPHQFRTPEDLSSSPIFFKDQSPTTIQEEERDEGQLKEEHEQTSETNSDSQSIMDMPLEEEEDKGDAQSWEEYDSLEGEAVGYWTHDEVYGDDDDDDAWDVPGFQNWEWMHQSLSTLLAGYRIHPISVFSKEQVRARYKSCLKEDLLLSQPQCQRHYLEEHGTAAQSVWEEQPASSKLYQQILPGTENDVAKSIMRRLGRDTTKNDSASIATDPSVLSSIVARECTGKLLGGNTDLNNHIPPIQRLHQMTGLRLSKIVEDMHSEIMLLENYMVSCDWKEVTIRLEDLGRLVDASHVSDMGTDPANDVDSNNPNVPFRPPSTSSFYAGKGVIGLERDAFVNCGGIGLLLRIIRKPYFVGDESLWFGNDARTLQESFVKEKLAQNWKTIFAIIKGLIYYIPELLEEGSELMEEGKFLPLLFTMLSHDCLFDSVVDLIEQILTLQAQGVTRSDNDGKVYTIRLESTPNPFSLERIPNVQELWEKFTCKQLAQFTRILLLLVYEVDERGDSMGQQKSVGLIQSRRDRDAKRNRDTLVNRNQRILLDDEELISRLMKLLNVINFAPELSKRSPNLLGMAQVNIIIQLLGFKEVSCWKEIDRLTELSEQLNDNSEYKSFRNGDYTEDAWNERDEFRGFRVKIKPREMGALNVFLDDLTEYRVEFDDPSDGQDQGGDARLDFIMHALNAANRSGLIIHRPRQNRSTPLGASRSDVHRDEIYTADIEYIKGNKNSPEHATDTLQFNAMILYPYLLDILIVFSTLISCEKRKFDAQKLLSKLGIVGILEDMFYLLSWPDAVSQSFSETRAEDEESTTQGSGKIYLSIFSVNSFF